MHAQQNPRLAESSIINHIRSLAENQKLAHGTIKTHRFSIFHIFEMNDIVLNKRKIIRFLPPNYSTISRRVNSQDIRISERHEVGNDIVIAVDSTGIKVANRGEWMRHKWHVRRGYLKIHVTVDIKNKKMISLEVTTEEVHDGKMYNDGKKLVDTASESNNVKGALADGMYDSNKNLDIYPRTILNPI